MSDDPRPLPPRPRTSDQPTMALDLESSTGADGTTYRSPTREPGSVEALESAETAPLPFPMVDPYVGRTIDGRYVIEGVLGEGGMGVVYRGRHKVIDKRVAIKVLRSDLAREPEITERFLQEARAASAIGNPHIVDISDFGQLPDGSTYFVMEYLDGKSLTELIEEARPIPIARLCNIAKQIARGLAAAHAADIVHRDLKPDNVMLVERGVEKDFVKILDFGIAKVGGPASQKTRAGSVFGTPHYMSPEQAAGIAVDSRTDIYALGVILYEMACGRVPFDADNFMGILTQHMYKAPVPIRALVPPIDVPPGLEAIVLKCLTKKPEGRYQTMEALIADLELLEKGLVPEAVGEMMARSGSFNVPADYFRSSPAIPAMLPGTPGQAKRPWWTYAAVGLAAMSVGTLGVVLVSRTTPTVTPTATATPTSNATPTTTPTTNPTATSTLVLVGVTPPDAKVTRDGVDLGLPPVALHLKPGETASLVISKDGYKTETLTVDATDEKRTVALKPVAPPRPAVKPVSKPARTGGAIDDVGDPFQKKR